MVNNEKLRLEFAARFNEALDKAGIRKRGRAVDVANYMSSIVGTMSPVAVGKWLKGEALPTSSNLLILAKWLHVRREWLEYGEGDKSPAQGGQLSGSEVVKSADVGSALYLRLVNQLRQADLDGRLSQDLGEAILKMIAAAAPQAASQSPQAYQSEPEDDEPPATLESIYQKQAIIDNRENLKHHKDQMISEFRNSKKGTAKKHKETKTK